ncbi:small GTP-binding protein [Tritrichomonas foetus]|uniref:Small GTP-binding protein n=1 Tax=Tritrichomonas foetus TaxID=1144522 RepID=A0A1J4JIB6_9EUKA|nr:small GTP-binding protein [Tritrichomonas foetus]|eukprot:OHS98882.1 small GTP-binding protein [Tritrichomonas foetus]
MLRRFAKAADIPRTHISMVGFMNAGKSSIMNAITQQPTSIVDDTPGTTADTKIALMEIHKLGPCKLLDTAGVDESGKLGNKKLVKTISAVKESDVVLFVIDPFNFRPEPFKNVIELAKRRGKVSAIIYNKFGGKTEDFNKKQADVANAIQRISNQPIPSITVSAINQKSTYDQIIPFIAGLKKQTKPVPLLPPKFVGPDKTLFLNVPLDIESPTGRLIRPQTMMLEFALRKLSPVVAYNMNLKVGRSENSKPESDRYLKNVKLIGPSLIVTDSQAIDLIHKWTPPEFPITTFSVAMANIQSGGKLNEFTRGIEAISKLKKGDKVLICEACNHDRIGDDIGTVQLPTKLKKVFPGVEIDWAFGRSYEDKKLTDYAVALHCGGCMISKQQMIARIQDLLESGVPVANYGLALSYLASPAALERVLKPWQ